MGQFRPLSWLPLKDIGAPSLLPTEPPLIAAGGYTTGLMPFSCISVCAATMLVDRPLPIQREALRVLRAAFGSCRVPSEEAFDAPLFLNRGPSLVARTPAQTAAALIDRDWEDQLSSENPAFEALSVAEREPPFPGSLRGPVVGPDPWGYGFPSRPEVSGLMPPTVAANPHY